MLTESADDVRKRVETLRMKVADRLPRSFAKLEIVPEISRAGGGALPMYDIPTYALQMEFLQGTAQRCDEYLVRQCPIPIIARLSKDRLLFDGRTILSTEEVEIIADGICRYFAQMQGGSDE
jgi:L-seryl-tRNA(Ser) seleniumtransferase